IINELVKIIELTSVMITTCCPILCIFTEEAKWQIFFDIIWYISERVIGLQLMQYNHLISAITSPKRKLER
ncbi:MAG TPA: hypothetical protein VGW09_00165, partial [Nitrososphaeraceae archaeon]|nr:hypothetical protein [Nitrososphaeraceae archaeon]